MNACGTFPKCPFIGASELISLLEVLQNLPELIFHNCPARVLLPTVVAGKAISSPQWSDAVNGLQTTSLLLKSRFLNAYIPEEFTEKYPALKKRRAVVSSDAHYLWDMRDKKCYFELDDEPYSGDKVRTELFNLLRGKSL